MQRNLLMIEKGLRIILDCRYKSAPSMMGKLLVEQVLFKVFFTPDNPF